MKKILLVNTFVGLFLQFGVAQNTESQSTKALIDKKQQTSVVVDSLVVPKKAASRKQQAALDSFPVPKHAALWSIIPGGGQIYNKKWAYIKVPIVYGALGTTIYLTAFNQSLYKKYKQADYNLRNSEPTNPQSGFSDIPNTTNTTRLRELRDAYFKQTQQMYILTGVTYLLAAAEAFTSAHLAHFDVTDDLSFRIKPSFEPLAANGSALGLGIQLKFFKNRR